MRLGEVNRRPPVWSLVVVLLVSFGLKLWILAAASATPERLLARDSASYERPARSLLRNGTLASEVDGVARPETLRTPGYPVFLAVVYGIAGDRPTAVVSAQILMSLGTLVLTWWLATTLFGSSTAIAAIVLLATEALSLGYSMMLLTETLFTFLWTGLGVAIVLFQRRPGPSSAFLAGLLLSLATLVRPVSYYLIVPAVVGCALWSLCLGIPRRRAALAAVALFLPFALLVGGWQLRNKALTGSGQLSRIEGANLLFFRGAAVVARRDGVSLEEARRRLGRGSYQELHPETQEWTQEQLSQRWSREGLELMLKHPLIAAEISARGAARIFLGPGEWPLARVLGFQWSVSGPLGDVLRLAPSDYWRRWVMARPLLVILSLFAALHLLVTYAGNLACLLVAVKPPRVFDQWPVHAALCSMAILLIVVSAGPESYYRFRAPLSPLLALYGGAGLMAIGRSLGTCPRFSRPSSPSRQPHARRTLAGGQRGGD